MKIKTISNRQLEKKIRFTLSQINLSFDIIKTLSSRQLYKLFRKASHFDSFFKKKKNELKRLSKEFLSFVNSKENPKEIIEAYDIETVIIENEQNIIKNNIINKIVFRFFDLKQILIY